MTYVADPADGTRPLDGDDASGGAAELRALKAYLQTLITGGATITGYAWQGGRNRWRNGDVRHDQRFVGVGVIGTTGQIQTGPDGHKIVYSQASKLAIGLAATGVIAGGTLGPLGCPNYVVVATNTAVAAPGAADFFAYEATIENTAVFDGNFGQTSARQICVTFWFRATISGDWSIALRNPTGPRTYPTKFTYNTANTWQFISLQIPGDVAASLMGTNGGTGIRIWIDLGSGTSFNAVSPNQWNANDLFKSTGCVEMIKTLNANFHISKCQLEFDNITPFEFLPQDKSLMWQHRYYYQSFYQATPITSVNLQRIIGVATTLVYGNTKFPVTMRDTPAVIVYNPATGVANSIRWNGVNLVNATVSSPGPDGFGGISVPGGGGTTGAGADYHYTASAEL